MQASQDPTAARQLQQGLAANARLGPATSLAANLGKFNEDGSPVSEGIPAVAKLQSVAVSRAATPFSSMEQPVRGHLRQQRDPQRYRRVQL